MSTPSILIVDDKKDNTDSLRDFFTVEPYNYKVFTAATVEEAQARARQEVIHVAVIDVKLKEPRDDHSGLLLAKMLPPFMGKVIITGQFYENPGALVGSALGHDEDDINADAFVWRRQGVKEIARKIEGTLRRMRLNLDLKVSWDKPLNWSMLVNQLKTFRDKDAAARAKAEDVLQDLTCKLFDDVEALHFLRLMPGHSKCVVAMAQAVVDGSAGQPWALKFGPREAIDREVTNYKKYVMEFVGTRSTQLRAGKGSKDNQEVYAVYTREMGAIAYRYIGERDKSTQDFAAHYKKADDAVVCKTLDHLFNETCESWYEGRRPPRAGEADPLDEQYRRQLNLWAPERVAELGEKFVSLMKASPPGMRLRPAGADIEVSIDGRPDLSLPNPFTFAMKKKNSQSGGDSFPPPSLVAITHGDLHGGNVLVSERGLTWLIDFYKTGRGPALRDFAELECDIKFDRLETNSLRVRYDLEVTLLSSNSLSPREPLSPASALPGPAARALTVIQHLRGLAAQRTEIEGMREYLVALLFYALKRIEGFTSATGVGESGSIPQYHALLSAALICNKLTLSGVNSKGVVFLAHPYRSPWVKRFRKDLKRFLTEHDYHVLHPLDDHKTGQLWLGVAEMLHNSTAVFCEIGAVNGNVLFELGYVMGLRKPYVLLYDERQGSGSAALPALLRGELRLGYRTGETLHRGALEALENGRDGHGRYFYEDSDFRRRAQAGKRPRPGSALLLTVNTPHQRKVVAPHLRLALEAEGWRVETIDLEGQLSAGDFYLRVTQFELVVGCFAAARGADISRANAELALALGIRCGAGKELIILQDKRGIILNDTTTLTKTFDGLEGAVKVLRAELKKRFPRRQRRARR